ncbi:MAG: hypothetical protein WBV72_10030 [Nitrososphaeraceae archaeon]
MSATATGVIVAENTTTYEFPRSKRKIVKDSKGNVMTVTAANVTVTVLTFMQEKNYFIRTRNF